MHIEKRIFDIVLALGLLPFVLLPLVVISVLIKVNSPGPILYWSERVGRSGRLFRMPKFRSMHMSTPTLATHLLQNPEKWITPFGSFLRKSSMDELPQIWSVFKGEMSFVGPRPVLASQTELVLERMSRGIYQLTPGMTGWAQINGRDNLSDQRKLELDVEYLERQSIRFDLEIILRTVLKVILRDGVTH